MTKTLGRVPGGPMNNPDALSLRMFLVSQRNDMPHEFAGDCLAASELIASQAAQIEALTKDAERFKGELLNIADKKRFKRDVFETDTEWADWAQSRARYVSSGDAAADNLAKETGA